jgi:hypothetical protein
MEASKGAPTKANASDSAIRHGRSTVWSEKVCVTPPQQGDSQQVYLKEAIQMRIASTYWLALAGASMMRRR